MRIRTKSTIGRRSGMPSLLPCSRRTSILAGKRTRSCCMRTVHWLSGSRAFWGRQSKGCCRTNRKYTRWIRFILLRGGRQRWRNGFIGVIIIPWRRVPGFEIWSAENFWFRYGREHRIRRECLMQNIFARYSIVCTNMLAQSWIAFSTAPAFASTNPNQPMPMLIALWKTCASSAEV